MSDDKVNVIKFSTAQEKRQAQEHAAFDRLSRSDARIKLLAATIEGMRESGSSKQEIVNSLRFCIDVLEGCER